VVTLFFVAFAPVAAGARAAEPAPEHHLASNRGPSELRRIVLRDSGFSGRLIRIEDAGSNTTLLSPEPVAAVAIRDVDFDGDLDVLAASSRYGLMVWRNDGNGGFALASPRHERPRPCAGLSAERGVSQCLGPGDDRQHPTVLHLPTRTRSLPHVHGPPVARSAGFHRQSTTRSGRAPPASC
jgi:hypothetical protein